MFPFESIHFCIVLPWACRQRSTPACLHHRAITSLCATPIQVQTSVFLLHLLTRFSLLLWLVRFFFFCMSHSRILFFFVLLSQFGKIVWRRLQDHWPRLSFLASRKWAKVRSLVELESDCIYLLRREEGFSGCYDRQYDVWPSGKNLEGSGFPAGNYVYSILMNWSFVSIFICIF